MLIYLIFFICVLGTIAITCAFLALAFDQKKTDRAAKKYLKIVGGIWLFFLIMLGVNACDHRENRIISIALEYTRMPPLPGSAKILHVKYGSSPFSANYWVTFQAPLSEIKVWLAGAKELKPEDLPEDLRGNDPPKDFHRYSIPQNERVEWGRSKSTKPPGWWSFMRCIVNNRLLWARISIFRKHR